MNPPSERRFPRLPLAKAEAGASPGAAAFLEDLIDACVMESGERMKYEGRMMKWDRSSGAFSSFIIHPSTLGPAPSHPIRNRLLRLTADSPDLLAIIKQEGKV
jgi:hypothetical protein